MRRLALAILIPVLAIAACGGTAVPPTPALTLNLATPRASATPAVATAVASASASAPASASAAATASATTAPTPTPSPTPRPTPTPTPAATPSPVALRTDVEAAFGALLKLAQLPTGADAQDPALDEEYTFDPFINNDGIRVVSQTWTGGESFTTLFQFVFQFASVEDAEKFLDEGLPDLSEAATGLEEATADPLFTSILDEVHYFEGELSALGITTQNHNYLFRLKNFVVKVFVAGTDVSKDVAEEIAFSAAQDLNTINLPRLPNATPVPTPRPDPSPTATTAGGFPSASEQAILDHVGVDTVASCEAADEFYGAEVDSVRCRPQEGLVVDYTLFESLGDLNEAFQADVEVAETPPTEAGDCDQANLLTTYTIEEGAEAGKIMCIVVKSNNRDYRVIEWTNEGLKILGYVQSATLEWDELIEYWRSKAGPYQ